MNRVLQFLSRPCSCCRELRAVEDKLNEQSAVAARLEHLAGPGVFEFWIPDAERVVRPKPDDDDGPGIALILAIEVPTADIAEDLTAFVLDHLRQIGEKCFTAAARIQAAGIEGVP